MASGNQVYNDSMFRQIVLVSSLVPRPLPALSLAAVEKTPWLPDKIWEWPGNEPTWLVGPG